MTATRFLNIPITHDGDGLNSAITRLNAGGYYAIVIGPNAILYGPQFERLHNRFPAIALVGDTLTIVDRSAQQESQDD